MHKLRRGNMKMKPIIRFGIPAILKAGVLILFLPLLLKAEQYLLNLPIA